MTSGTAENAVLAEVSGGIMTITLNRPNHGNAWNPAVSNGYFGFLQDAARAPEVRVIIVTGAGKAFCTGGDGEKLAEVASSTDTRSSSPFWLPLRIGKPIIAAVNGACFGIGLQQALCCDLRFASDDSKFSTAYARRGLVAEFGMSWLLPRLIGTGNAMDMMLSARLVRAAEAERMGLVNRVLPASDLMTETIEYARQLVERCSPRSMQVLKRQLYADLMSNYFMSYQRSETLLTEATSRQDYKEGIRSWRENRAPEFAPLPEEFSFIEYDE